MSDVQQLMNWSKQPIAFGPEDHPDVMPTPGDYCLILDPTIIAGRLTCTFSKVLMDGGSSINILYKDTDENLGIRESGLLPSQIVFTGIIPGKAGTPMGMCWLDEIGRAHV